MKTLLEKIEMFTEEKDSEYQKFFKKKLKEFGVEEPDELSKEDKKKFYSEVEKEWDKEEDHVDESEDEEDDDEDEEKKDKKKSDDDEDDDEDDLDEKLNPDEHKEIAMKTIMKISKLVINNKLNIDGKKYNIEKVGKYTINLKGDKGAKYMLSPSPNSEVVDDKEYYPFTVSRATGGSVKNTIYGIKDNKIVKLYKGN